MTCTAMSGNGVRTGMGITPQALLLTPPDHRAVRTGWVEAVAGATPPGTVVQLFAAATRPA